MPKYLFSLTFIFLLYIGLEAQNQYPQNYFQLPINKALSLVGNFGEIRPNHLHAGFDIRTDNKEGMPIYAAADGYVSRIKVSPYGYGNALYISHPNGYTTVYGHLKSFNSTIQAFERKVQFNKESFEIDTLLSNEKIPVKKGDFIGLSGNTGGSQGPHLHFEIRDSKSEFPINPYLFGYTVDDTTKPRITQLAIYPINNFATINGKNESKKIAPNYKNGIYSFLKTDTLTVSGAIGFGIECYDTETKSTNNNAVYSIELQLGGKRIYYYEMEKFSFENARYVNAHIDYPHKQRHDTKIQKCFLTKNNQLGIYKGVINNGIYDFNDDSVHWVKYIVKDYFSNTTELMLKVKSQRHDPINFEQKNNNQKLDCFSEFKLEKKNITITIPANALYDDVKFKYDYSASAKGTFSPLYTIMNNEIPLQKAYSLDILPEKLPDFLQSKACIISINDKGKRSYEGGNYKDGFVKTQTKNFGKFAVTIDTIPPKINTAFPIQKNKPVNLSNAKTIGISVSDNLSGVRKYRATIDDNWVLMEYETKQNLLFYTFDDKILAGTHIFKIDVSDDKSNLSTLQFTFIR